MSDLKEAGNTLRKAVPGDIASTTASVALGVPQHIVATKNGSSVHLYINGVDSTGTITDCLPRPQDPAVALSLVRELRAHFGAALGTPEAHQAPARYAVASLAAGVLLGQKYPPPRTAPRTEARTEAERELRRDLALAGAEVRVLFAELAGEDQSMSRGVLSSHGRTKTVLSGPGLQRHHEQLAADRALIAHHQAVAEL